MPCSRGSSERRAACRLQVRDRDGVGVGQAAGCFLDDGEVVGDEACLGTEAVNLLAAAQFGQGDLFGRRGYAFDARRCDGLGPQEKPRHRGEDGSVGAVERTDAALDLGDPSCQLPLDQARTIHKQVGQVPQVFA